MKRLFPLILLLALLLLVSPCAMAASADAQAAADELYLLGLFQGVGTQADGTPNFDLDRAPSRNEAVAMLVRLLGKEEEAKAGSWNIPFTDVAAWAKPYVGYAYAKGLTKGLSATKYGGNQLVNANQYLTFILRALGYDSSKDFSWDKAWQFTDQLNITHREYTAASAFTRGDAAIVSAAALFSDIKGSDHYLFFDLKEAGVFNSLPHSFPFMNFYYLSDGSIDILADEVIDVLNKVLVPLGSEMEAAVLMLTDGSDPENKILSADVKKIYNRAIEEYKSAKASLLALAAKYAEYWDLAPLCAAARALADTQDIEINNLKAILTDPSRLLVEDYTFMDRTTQYNEAIGTAVARIATQAELVSSPQ